ncbi:unnamed protein product [Plasmodium vivax]|nr:unnamed protein product [Plasmodium vivax]CAI7718841.1 Plasmodium exported protein (PHIST), unknown function [Plasmodium vivax]
MCHVWRFFGASAFMALLVATMGAPLLGMKNGAKGSGFPEPRPTCGRSLSDVLTMSYEPMRRTNLNEIKKGKISTPLSSDVPRSDGSDVHKILTGAELTEEIISFGIFPTKRQAYKAHAHLIDILKANYYVMMQRLWKNFKQSASKNQIPEKVQKKMWADCAIANRQELNRLNESSKKDFSSFLKRPIIFFIHFDNFLGNCTKSWNDSVDENRRKWELLLAHRIASYSASG